MALVDQSRRSRVDRETWLSENALWSKWTHVGTTECKAMCEVLLIDPQKLYSALRSPIFKAYIEHYGFEYHKRLTAQDRDPEEYPSDLPDSVIDNIEVMTALPELLLVHMGLITAGFLQERTWMWHLFSGGPIDFSKLTEEVRSGRTVLVPCPHSEVLRVARVSCVEIVRHDGFLLAQIGKFDSDGNLKPECMLPGTKVYGWENQHIAFERFLWEDLHLSDHDMDMLGVRDECYFRHSHKYELQTKFYRTVH